MELSIGDYYYRCTLTRNCCDMPVSGIHWPFYHHVTWDACSLVALQPRVGSLPPWPQEASASVFLCFSQFPKVLSSAKCQAGFAAQPSWPFTRKVWKAMTKRSPVWPEDPTYVVHWGLQRSFRIGSLYRGDRAFYKLQKKELRFPQKPRSHFHCKLTESILYSWHFNGLTILDMRMKIMHFFHFPFF